MSSPRNTASAKRKSKRSAERNSSAQKSSPPPEFLLDRCLGKGVAIGLAELGWIIHRITDHFPNDAQAITDEEWIDYGLCHGWIPLCKDSRIKSRPAERRPLVDHDAPLFYLDNQQLVITEMIARFHSAQAAIYRAIRRGGAAAYAVGPVGQRLRKTWP
ncbi:hypothetical protein NDR87_26255 [Nocardia sp. CDC159]|uniref:VapC45 PIN like domain-containing protein n=1 Tax=Nocardia pulmonis TaxID=2951408 RepID=A0A9X2E7B9_9NOCA|nr:MULTISPECIES: hypothetical protein [Nocardia]MCM6774950.1 hypothetical protein [Nocardia pulmonis]MCM6789881.1 hypothetical protein [Nocardia sp. CDC159]